MHPCLTLQMTDEKKVPWKKWVEEMGEFNAAQRKELETKSDPIYLYCDTFWEILYTGTADPDGSMPAGTGANTTGGPAGVLRLMCRRFMHPCMNLLSKLPSRGLSHLVRYLVQAPVDVREAGLVLHERINCIEINKDFHDEVCGHFRAFGGGAKGRGALSTHGLVLKALFGHDRLAELFPTWGLEDEDTREEWSLSAPEVLKVRAVPCCALPLTSFAWRSLLFLHA